MALIDNKRFRDIILGGQYDLIKKRRTDLRPAFGGRIDRNRLLPDSPNVVQIDTYWKVYKNEAPIRGAIIAVVNAATSTGWDVVTNTKDDVDVNDKKVKKVTDWLQNPKFNFISVIRDLCLNLMIHDNSFAEIKKNVSETKLGWIYPLDTRDCELRPPADNASMGELVHNVRGQSMRDTLLQEEPENFTGKTVGEYIHLSLHRAGGAHGLSPLESIVRSADLSYSAYAYNQNLFDANGVPALAFFLDEGDVDDYDILVAATKNIKQGESFVAKGKVRVEPLGGKISDMGYKELVEQVYQDVMTVLQVPPVIMSMPGSSTLESTREETSAFSMNIDAIQLVLNNAVDQAIVMVWGNEYLDIRFRLKPWVNEKAQAAIDEIYSKWGVYTPNFILKRKGLPTVWWGEVPYNINGPLGAGIGSVGMPMGAPAGWNGPPKAEAGGGKPPGESGGGGRTGSTPRPSEQGSGSNPVKELLRGIEELVKIAKHRENDIKILMETNKNLTNMIEHREKQNSIISKQLE